MSSNLKEKNNKNSNGRTHLINAVLNKNFKECKSLIQKGANINIQDNFGSTALMYAADNDKFCNLLIENGADTNIKDNNGETALMAAVLENNYDVCELLIDNGVDINIQSNNIEEYDNNLNLNIEVLKYKIGETALMFAIEHNYYEICNLLLENNANLNLRDSDGKTVLMNVITTDNNNEYELLINYIQNIELDLPDNSGRTALIYATINNKVNICNLLIQNGANLNLADISGKTALDYSIENNFSNITILLSLNQNNSIENNFSSVEDFIKNKVDEFKINKRINIDNILKYFNNLRKRYNLCNDNSNNFHNYKTERNKELGKLIQNMETINFSKRIKINGYEEGINASGLSKEFYDNLEIKINEKIKSEQKIIQLEEILESRRKELNQRIKEKELNKSNEERQKNKEEKQKNNEEKQKRNQNKKELKNKLNKLNKFEKSKEELEKRDEYKKELENKLTEFKKELKYKKKIDFNVFMVITNLKKEKNNLENEKKKLKNNLETEKKKLKKIENIEIEIEEIGKKIEEIEKEAKNKALIKEIEKKKDIQKKIEEIKIEIEKIEIEKKEIELQEIEKEKIQKDIEKIEENEEKYKRTEYTQKRRIEKEIEDYLEEKDKLNNIINNHEEYDVEKILKILSISKINCYPIFYMNNSVKNIILDKIISYFDKTIEKNLISNILNYISTDNQDNFIDVNDNRTILFNRTKIRNFIKNIDFLTEKNFKNYINIKNNYIKILSKNNNEVIIPKNIQNGILQNGIILNNKKIKLEYLKKNNIEKFEFKNREMKNDEFNSKDIIEYINKFIKNGTYVNMYDFFLSHFVQDEITMKSFINNLEFKFKGGNNITQETFKTKLINLFNDLTIDELYIFNKAISGFTFKLAKIYKIEIYFDDIYAKEPFFFSSCFNTLKIYHTDYFVKTYFEKYFKNKKNFVILVKEASEIFNSA